LTQSGKLGSTKLDILAQVNFLGIQKLGINKFGKNSRSVKKGEREVGNVEKMFKSLERRNTKTK
jgi:hypothetical protein